MEFTIDIPLLKECFSIESGKENRTGGIRIEEAHAFYNDFLTCRSLKRQFDIRHFGINIKSAFPDVLKKRRLRFEDGKKTQPGVYI